VDKDAISIFFFEPTLILLASPVVSLTFTKFFHGGVFISVTLKTAVRSFYTPL
jgi:hypothetical protein